MKHDAHPQPQVPLIKKDDVIPETEGLWYHSSLLKLLSHGISDAKTTSLLLDPSSWSNHAGTE